MQAGSHEAAAALSRLLRAPVLADAFTSQDARQLGAAHGERVVVVALEASGGVKGSFALVINEDVAASLADRLTGASTLDGAVGKGALAALAELGNIAASAFLNGAARVVGRTCVPSVPRVVHAPTSDAIRSVVGGAAVVEVATLRLHPQQWFSVVFTG